MTLLRTAGVPPVRPGRAVHRSRADDVYEQIRREVAAFELIPGDRLTENELSARLGVSRTPVRQALFRLQQEGVVEVLFRSGWRVLPFDFDRLDQLYDLRTVLETTAVRRICAGERHVDHDRLAGLAAIWLAPAAARSDDPEQVARWDEDFHCALVGAAGNAEMARVHREITERIRIVRRLDFTQRRRVCETYNEHAKILKAIRHKNADAAAMLLSAHIATSQAEVRKITLHQIYLAKAGVLDR